MNIVHNQNGRRIIYFGPHKNGIYSYSSNVYEIGKNRLTVDTVEKNGQRLYQTKTYTEKGRTLKEIVIFFADGIRKTIERIT